LFLTVYGVDTINKRTQENIRNVTETEISNYTLERLENYLKSLAKSISDCDLIVRDCMINLETANKMEDIKESKDLKAKINDASANREIFELKAKVVSVKIKQLKHEMAIALCGDKPVLPYGMDPLTFGTIVDSIYEHTEEALIGDPKSTEGKKIAKQIQAVLKANPKLKEYSEKR
jgi:hypothetical protein